MTQTEKKRTRRVIPRPIGDLYGLPTTVDIRTAGQFFAIAADTCYRHARTGQFPVPVLRIGGRYRVTRAALLAALDPDGVAAPKRSEPITDGEAAAVARVRAVSHVPNVAPNAEDVGVLLAVLDRVTADTRSARR